jgi:tetratricopeptide (TPR) repeat protein
MDINTYIQRAQKALQDGEFDLARQYFQQILGRYPNNPDALKGIQDIQLAQTKIRLSTWKRELKLLWANILLLMRKPESASADLDILYTIQPNHKRTIMAYASMCDKLKRYEDAHKAYQSILKLDSSNQAILRANAEVLVKLDKLDSATELLQRLHALRPNDDEVEHRLRDISRASVFARGDS